MTPRERPNPYQQPPPAPPPVVRHPAPDGEPGPPPLPGEPITHREGGHLALAPFYLLFRPGFFFQRYGAACPLGLTCLLLYVVGVAATIDRIDLQSFTQRQNLETLGILDSWGTYWGFALGGAVCASLGIALIRVGWYWVRLKLCGVKRPEYGVAMNLFTFSSLLWATPTLAMTGTSTALFATPREADHSASLWWIPAGVLAIVALFWSTWVSYRGVRAVYAPRRASTLAWFLVIPWIVQAIGSSAVIAGAFLLAPATPPDLGAPKAHDGPTFALEYPANWVVANEQEPLDQSGLISISPTDQDATIRLQVYQPTGDIGDELDTAADSFADTTDFTLTAREDIGSIGHWRGTGRRYDAAHPEGQYVIDILVTPVTEWYNLDIVLIYLPADEPVIRPGIDHVLNTVKVRTPDRAPADLANGYYVRSGPYNVLVPGNWTWEESASGGPGPDAAVRRLDLYPHAEGTMRLMEYAFNGTPEESVEDTIEFRLQGGEELARAPLASWGPFSGAGALVRYRLPDGTAYRLAVVVEPAADGRYREVQVISADGAATTLDPGFQFIERTIEVAD